MPPFFYAVLRLFLEVTVVEAFEALAVTCLVLGHFVNGVVNGVKVELLRFLCKLELARGRAVLGGNSHFEILLRAVGQDLSEQFGKYFIRLFDCFLNLCKNISLEI